MATYLKFDQTPEDWLHGVYQSDTDQFTVALTASASAPVAGNSVLADLTQISYANLSSRDLTTTTSAQVSGLYTQLFADLTLSATGAVATFRFVVIFNNTPTSPIDPLLCFYDFGSDLTLADGESLTIDFTTATFTVQ